MMVISCYTPDYKCYADILKISLNAWNIDYDIEEYPNIGNWKENTKYKTIYMLEKLQEHKIPLVWLDSDAIVVNYPKKINSDLGDLAFYRTKKNPITSLLYFDYNSKVLDLLKKWIEFQKDFDNFSQQQCFNQLDFSDYDITHLPFTYCCILDEHTDRKLGDRTPTIIQTQRSRIVKNEKT